VAFFLFFFSLFFFFSRSRNSEAAEREKYQHRQRALSFFFFASRKTGASEATWFSFFPLSLIFFFLFPPRDIGSIKAALYRKISSFRIKIAVGIHPFFFPPSSTIPPSESGRLENREVGSLRSGEILDRPPLFFFTFFLCDKDRKKRSPLSLSSPLMFCFFDPRHVAEGRTCFFDFPARARRSGGRRVFLLFFFLLSSFFFRSHQAAR